MSNSSSALCSPPLIPSPLFHPFPLPLLCQPPKFNFSSLYQTAREASKRIVDDLLYSAGVPRVPRDSIPGRGGSGNDAAGTNPYDLDPDFDLTEDLYDDDHDAGPARQGGGYEETSPSVVRKVGAYEDESF